MPTLSEDLVIPFTIGGLSPFAERLIARMEPWDTGPPIVGSTDLDRYLRSLATMFEPVEVLAAESGEDGSPNYTPAWGTLLDVTTAPASALPYLAMYVGVILPTGVTEAEARALIKAESGLERGTEASVKAAIERGISRFWAPDTEYLEGQLVRHESTPGSLLCYEVTETFTSGATFVIPSGVTPPTLEPISASETGGELGPGLYYYTITAIVAGVETGVSNERSFDAGGTNKWKAKLKWSAVPSATNYRVYRGSTPGGESVVHEVGAVTEYTDTGPGFTAATPPEPLTLINIATQYELLPREKANGESNAYYFTVLCHPQQLVPEGNTTQLDGYVKGTKPAGLVPEYVVTEEPLQTDPYIDEGTLLIEEVSAEILTATLAQVT
jgi:hypothetical protein